VNVGVSRPRISRARSLASELARALETIALMKNVGRFEGYHDDPVGYCRDVLGFEPWSQQRKVLEALVAHDWVTVRSGHGVGKSAIDGAAALWFWSTRGPGARVILTATKFQQITEVVWAEIRRMYIAAKQPLGGDLPVLPTTGLRSEDGRQIFGITASEAESFAGIRAPEMLVIADEASGIDERIFEAMMGNLAGGGKLLLTGNPTKSTGFFFESHKSERFRRIHIPSTLSPNVTGEMRVKGLVTPEWIQDRREAWGGETGVLYRIRVMGEFVEQSEGRLFPPALILEAEVRWTKEDCLPTGPLCIGVDPAGDGGDGDESGFAARRGKRIVHLHTRAGLSDQAHVVDVLGIIAEHRGTKEQPLIVLDRDGVVGARVYGAMLTHLAQHPEAFKLIGFRGSEPAKRRPQEIHLHRDELWFNLVEIFREGLAVPPHVKLQGDLAAMRFDRLVHGKATVLRKQTIRRELGRSPDLGDALALACYRPADFSALIESQLRAGPGGQPGALEQRAERTFDPYSSGDPYDGMKVWRGR